MWMKTERTRSPRFTWKMVIILKMVEYLSGQFGNVWEFYSCQGKVRESSRKNLVRETVY